jgi:lipid II:glycine glycyltransferase (peptidoglycan interpeptide bridge formation enzyme)
MNLIVLEKPNDKWDEFVSVHSNLIFHTSLWWKVLKEGYGCGMRYLVFEEGGYWLSALPGMMVGNRLFKVFYSLVPYGGFIGNREHITEFLSLLSSWAKKEKIQRIQIVDLAIKEKQDLPDFNCVESYRHLLELKGKTTDQLWKNYKDSLKRNIKTALKSDLCFEKIKSRDEVDLFYRLYLASMRRNKALAKYPVQLFLKIYDLLVPESSDIFFAKYQNQPVAVMVVIYSEETAHYFHGGSATEYLHLRPNDLLFHHAIQIAKEREKLYFDFLGSDKRFLSLIQFKDKWGTKREELLNFHKDVGVVRPFLFKIALSLAQTSFGSAIHRRLKSIRKGS